MAPPFEKDRQYWKFCAYGFLKNLRFFDAFLLIFFLQNELSFTEIGILYAARELTTNLAEIPSGLVADAWGRKYALLGAFALYILSFLTFYVAEAFFPLLAAMLLFGVADAFRSGTHKGMIMDYLRLHQWGTHKVAYYGLTRSWSQKGSALSALLAGVLVFFSGEYRLIYAISILPYCLNFINIYTYPDTLNFPLKAKKTARKALMAVWRDFFASVKDKQVWAIMNSAALHTAFLKAIKDYIQPLMLNLALLLPIMRQLDPDKKGGLVIGISYFFIYLLSAQASQFAGKVLTFKISRLAHKTLLMGLLVGLLCGISTAAGYWFPALLFFILIYLIENLRKPILTGVLTDSVPPAVLTSVLSAQSSYRTLITSVLALGIGWLADWQGIGLALGLVSGALFLLTWLLPSK